MKVIKKIIYWIGLVLLWVIAAGVATNFVVEKDQAISAAITVVVAIVIHLLWRKKLRIGQKEATRKGATPKQEIAAAKDKLKAAKEKLRAAQSGGATGKKATKKVQELEEDSSETTQEQESIPGQLVISGTQLVMDFVQHPIDDVNSKEKLRKVLLEYLPQRHLGDRDSCLLAESFEDGSGNSIEVNQDRDDPWRVIPKPEIGNIVFVAYYTYSDEIYRTSYQDLESVTVLTREFSGDYEEYVTKIVENDVELVTEIDDTGEHDGEVLLSFEIHSEEHGMEDLSVSISHLDYDSEDDVNEMVDNVFERLEPYL